MAGKRKKIVDIYALLQHLRAGHSNRHIKRELGFDRRTAQKYREWAEEYSLLTGSLPPIEELYQLLEETMPPQQPPQMPINCGTLPETGDEAARARGRNQRHQSPA